MKRDRPGSGGDRGHRGTVAAAAILAALLGAAPRPAEAQLDSGLTAIEGAGEAEASSTIVEIPAPITLRQAADGRIGVRLRLSVFFAWNDVRFQDIGGDDVTASLRTLTVVPGVELLIPVGERWLVRPYGQIGGLEALDVEGRRWMTSLGGRAAASWELDRWILTAGGRVDYGAVFDEDWRRTDDVGYVEIGADFSFPLGFDVRGQPAAAGIFIIPRLYLDPADVVGLDGFDLEVDAHLEIGASFQIRERPKIWFVSLPKWYGIGVRLAESKRSIRIYLGFPF
ncbi:MAG: autotransporter outer membrane beta-barrel domain-containing protein [Thermoanaerobaculales bacterium]|jgi:hypothetical protein|nr:autotransporter outer membrane beta-barrel domain-containing protein [Thermoanaerobaculales bacterium]